MRSLYRPALLLLVLFTAFKSQSQQLNDKNTMDLIRKNASVLHLSSTEIDNSIVSSSYVDEKTNIRYVYLQQGYKGVKVFNTLKTIIIRNGEVVYSSGNFVNGLEQKAPAAQPQVEATAAIQAAATHLRLQAPASLKLVEDKFTTDKKLSFSPAGIAKDNIQTELFWVASDDGSSVRLAWNVNIDVLGSPDWWNVRIDAASGQFIEKDNWTIYEKSNKEQATKTDRTQANTVKYSPEVANRLERFQYKPFTPPTTTTATYFVVPFPGESPIHLAHATETNPWTKAGTNNNATTNGWHFDGNTNFDVTRGNNVYAYLDVLNNNTPGSSANWPDTSSSTTAGTLTFGNNPAFAQAPTVSLNRKAAVTNLFYWNNIIHDVIYQYGFTEVSGNFQADNMGRGGNGGDYVQAEAQDASGTNNANFSTPSDGTRPRMQMYLFDAVPGVKVNAPSSIAGTYQAIEGNYSTANLLASTGPVTGQVVYMNDPSGGLHEGCSPPTNSLTGKIALIDRGNCNFTVKIKNAQDAGAIGAIMINNVAGAPIIMGGSDNSITIPSMMVSQTDGAILISQLANGLNATLTPGVGLDGDFDNGVVTHEFSHGISNRLTGGPANASCLSNAEQGGEGWSDYVGLMLTTKWATAGINDGATKPRGIGQYVIGQSTTGSGIRTYPYSTNMTTNPLTYANLASTSTEVHFIGEVWCAALWDMTWNIIQQTNSIEPNIYNASGTGGNVIALKLVIEGMRLQPCRPGFLDARDAILAADSILYGGAYKCAIWRAFARRGMGFSAQQGLSTSASDQVAAFDVPSAVQLKKSSAPVSISSGTQTTVTIAATCQCAVPANTYTIRDTIPTGFSYVSSTGGGVNSGSIVTFTPLNFTNTGEVKTVTVTIKADLAGCGIDTTINDNREVSTIGGLTASTLSGSGTFSTSTVRSKSGTSSWYGNAVNNSGDYVLTSGTFTAGSFSVLSFWHYYVLENGYDAGRVEISPDGGNTWIDANPYFVQNGYNTTMNGNSPIGGQRAFSGVSYAQVNGNFINSVINLAPFAGQSLKVRFRVQTSPTNTQSYEGWFIDDIQLMNGCGGMVKAGLYNSSNVKIDSSSVPVFVRPNLNAPASILTQPAAVATCPGSNATFSVTASTSGTQALTYQWQVSTNGGTSYTDIAGATSSSYTVTGVTAGMANNLYRCIINNGNGPTTSNGAVLTLTTTPSGGVVANAGACPGQTATFNSSVTGTGVSYQWQISTDGGTSYTNIAGATAATLSLSNVTSTLNNNRYRVVISNNCGSAPSTAGTLTVNTATPVTINSTPAGICNSDAAVTLGASVNGGIWSGTGVTGNVFNPATLAPAPYTITYTYTNDAGCVSTASTVITVNPKPTVTADSKQVCIESSVALTGTPAGGTWSGTNVTGSSFNAMNVAAGNYTVTYSYTAPSGCAASATATVAVNLCGNGLNTDGAIELRLDNNTGHYALKFNTGLYPKLSMSVFASDGKLIYRYNMENIQFGDVRLITTHHLAAGIYMLSLLDEPSGQTKTFRFVVNR